MEVMYHSKKKKDGGNETKAKENNNYLLIPREIHIFQLYLPLFFISTRSIHTAIAWCILPEKSTFLSQISSWTYICLSCMLLMPEQWFVTRNLCNSININQTRRARGKVIIIKSWEFHKSPSSTLRPKLKIQGKMDGRRLVSMCGKVAEA